MGFRSRFQASSHLPLPGLQAERVHRLNLPGMVQPERMIGLHQVQCVHLGVAKLAVGAAVGMRMQRAVAQLM